MFDVYSSRNSEVVPKLALLAKRCDRTTICTGGALAKDLEDLFALLKAEHGIPDPKGRTANRLSADQIPAVPKPDIQVKLLAMRDLQHVNAIAANQRLPFGSTGLSVI